MLLYCTHGTNHPPQVTGLNSGRGLRMRIYSENEDGRSNATVIEGNTLKVAELQIGKGLKTDILYGIQLGVLSKMFKFCTFYLTFVPVFSQYRTRKLFYSAPFSVNFVFKSPTFPRTCVACRQRIKESIKNFFSPPTRFLSI